MTPPQATGSFLLLPRHDRGSDLKGLVEIEVTFPGIGRISIRGTAIGHERAGGTDIPYITGTIRADDLVRIIPLHDDDGDHIEALAGLDR